MKWLHLKVKNLPILSLETDRTIQIFKSKNLLEQLITETNSSKLVEVHQAQQVQLGYKVKEAQIFKLSDQLESLSNYIINRIYELDKFYEKYHTEDNIHLFHLLKVRYEQVLEEYQKFKNQSLVQRLPINNEQLFKSDGNNKEGKDIGHKYANNNSMSESSLLGDEGPFHSQKQSKILHEPLFMYYDKKNNSQQHKNMFQIYHLEQHDEHPRGDDIVEELYSKTKYNYGVEDQVINRAKYKVQQINSLKSHQPKVDSNKFNQKNNKDIPSKSTKNIESYAKVSKQHSQFNNNHKDKDKYQEKDTTFSQNGNSITNLNFDASNIISNQKISQENVIKKENHNLNKKHILNFTEFQQNKEELKYAVNNKGTNNNLPNKSSYLNKQSKTLSQNNMNKSQSSISNKNKNNKDISYKNIAEAYQNNNKNVFKASNEEKKKMNNKIIEEVEESVEEVMENKQSQLKFTIKMTKEEYKMLLEMKRKLKVNGQI